MLGLVCLMRSIAAADFLWAMVRWERGKLFRLFKFRTRLPHAQTLEHEVMGNQKSAKREDGKSITLRALDV